MRHLQQVKEFEVRINELQKEKEAAVMKEAVKLEVTKQSLFDSERSCSELERKLAVAYEEVQRSKWLHNVFGDKYNTIIQISTLQAVIHKQCEERQLLLKAIQK